MLTKPNYEVSFAMPLETEDDASNQEDNYLFELSSLEM